MSVEYGYGSCRVQHVQFCRFNAIRILRHSLQLAKLDDRCLAQFTEPHLIEHLDEFCVKVSA